MAVYEDKEITAELITDKFPTVASAIIAQAQEGEPEMNKALVEEKYPEIAEAFKKEGMQEGLSVGAEAEKNRLAAIDALDISGYDAGKAAQIVADAKADGSITADNVKLKLFDLGVKTKDVAASARAEDGKSLAAMTADVGSEPGAMEHEEKTPTQLAHERVMKKLGKGEK